ncbi:MAG: XdhC family protein [Chitinophagaceae bacterium]|nr:XdhC family protein [Chitinophagaceae bacterium]
MNEIKNIVLAFDEATKSGKKTALATVVHVEGSSYRRPGARMLVDEDGKLTGAISGGCLEGDALRKALLAINQDKKKLVTYDTTDDDDAKLGIQLGCNGIVSILFEPIDEFIGNNPIDCLRLAVNERKPTVIHTGYSLVDESHYGTFHPDDLPEFIKEKLCAISLRVLNSGTSSHFEMVLEERSQQLFFDFCNPSISLIIVGAGNDAMPLLGIAATMGWECTIVDGRATHANKKRFQMADRILVGKPTELINQLVIDHRTALVLMTHNYQYDIEMLACLQKQNFGYLGLLGPSAKRERQLHELADRGVFYSDETFKKIYGPTGLSLGAETAAEIALSISAEILAVMEQSDPIHLKFKIDPIHQPA